MLLFSVPVDNRLPISLCLLRSTFPKTIGTSHLHKLVSPDDYENMGKINSEELVTQIAYETIMISSSDLLLSFYSFVILINLSSFCAHLNLLTSRTIKRVWEVPAIAKEAVRFNRVPRVKNKMLKKEVEGVATPISPP